LNFRQIILTNTILSIQICVNKPEKKKTMSMKWLLFRVW